MTARCFRARPRGLHRGVVAGLVAIAIPSAGGALAPEAIAGVPAVQALVVLRGPHVARRAPSSHGARIEAVVARRPLTRTRTVLPVLRRAGRGEHRWLQVRLPGRPNGHSGWISAERTRATSTEWRIQVALAARRVIVYRSGRAVRRYPAIVGKPATPTPRGSFFVEEALRLLPGAAGAPFALATSARSNALHEFDGGPGQIALHGTGNLNGALGTAVSHGCVRLDARAISWLASRIGAGVPVTIGQRG